MTATAAYFVTRTMQALELLSRGPQSTAAVAAMLQIHERTAQRMLARLTDEGYVIRPNCPRSPHALTDRLSALGVRALLTRHAQFGVVPADSADHTAVVVLALTNQPRS